MVARHTRIFERATARLRLRHLRLLVAVGKHQNIQKAARELNISQPAATKMIQDLELDFEVQLFERTNRGVAATVFGESLIRHAKLIFAQVSHAAQELDDLTEGSTGRVVVGTLLAASPHVLPLAIERVLRSRPRVAIKVVEGTNEVLMPALSSGEIDLVVGRLPVHRHRRELVQERLFDEQILVVGGADHPLGDRPDVSFADLAPFGWVVPPVETSLRRQLDAFFVKQDQYVPPIFVESVSYLTNRALLQGRDFVGLMPAQVVAHDIAQGVLKQLSWEVPFGVGPVGVSYRGAGRLSPAGQTFLQALREVAAGME